MNPPDWQLPAGVSRAVWDYLHNAELARTCDERLAGSPLLEFDLRLAERFFSTPGTLVDLGCGTGRLAIPFAQRGFSVLGVDLSAAMLKVSADKPRAANADLQFIRANLVELDCLRDECFDYAACLFSTLGMISGRDNRRKALMHVRRILKPGGRFLLHVHNLWFHLGTRAGRRWLLRDRLRAITGDPGAGDYAATHAVALHHFSKREILNDLKATGFKVLMIEPVSLRTDCRLPARWLIGGLRAYGFLIGSAKL
jgi:SAM-dependent methyltransferase